MEIFENKMEITFTNNASAIKAKEVATEVLNSSKQEFWFRNAPTNMIKRLIVEGNVLINPEDEGDFDSSELLETTTSILKAIAEQLPSESFTFDIYGEDTYTEGSLEGKYEDGSLEINSTYYPSGYIEYLCCPECGEEVILISDYDPNKKYTCPECGEEIDLSEEYDKCAPIIETKIIKIS